MEGSKNIKYTVGSVSVSSISSRNEQREKYVGVTYLCTEIRNDTHSKREGKDGRGGKGEI